MFIYGLPWWLSDNLSADAGDVDSISESGRSTGGGNDSPLLYCCLENLWTEEPCRLQTMGSQRVGQDLVTEQQQMFIYVIKKQDEGVMILR